MKGEIEKQMRDIKNLEVTATNIRKSIVKMICEAKSGHPGGSLSATDILTALYFGEMNIDPNNPKMENRDRFILSAGHGSALLYSLLHMFGYEGMTVEELKNFRQFDSLTPGHPEYRHTVGVESTTGPLGAGVSTAVGMAIAEAHLAAEFNKEAYPVVDHYTYALTGDGCLMEGVAYEALSLAGTLKLDKLIVLYDSNNITIEGDTAGAFTEDVAARFEAFGFQVQTVEDGNDLEAVGKAIENAKADKQRPSVIICKTHIGYGSPKQDSASVHGSPLGADGVAALRKNLSWESDEAFFVAEEVYDHYNEIAKANAEKEEDILNLIL